jgi:peptidoglycan-N-acetylglucosamine deacetylase
MSQAKKIACQALLAFLLAMFWLPTRVEYSAPSRSGPLRLAFIDSTSPEARITLKKHLNDLDGVIGEWLNVDSDGNVSEEEDPGQDGGSPSATIDFIRARRPLTVLALVSDEPGSNRAFARLGDPSFRWRLEQQLLRSVGQFNFDGLLINFQDMQTADEAELRELIGELHDRLAARNKTIGVVLPADSFMDYKALGSRADMVVIKLYEDVHSSPGPLAPEWWSRRFIAERSRDIPADKLIFAVASTGREWSAAGDGAPQFVSFGAIMLATSSQHVPIRFDPGSRNPHLDYIDNEGARHEIWFLDAATAFNQIRSVVAWQAHGIALRELGAEDQSIWSFFKTLEAGRAFERDGIERLRCDEFAMRVGQGEVYRFKNAAADGRRSVELNESGDIVYESYDVVPRPWELEVSGLAPARCS